MSVRGGPAVIAHRGDPSRAPENTLAAVRLALEAEPDFIEVDVHLSADGHLVVIHDATLERTTTGSGPVSGRSLEQLQRLDAGGWFAAAFAGEAVPTLTDVWEALDGNSRLAVELKGQGTGAATGRWATELGCDVPTFLSFQAEELGALRSEFPEAELIVLSAGPVSSDSAELAGLLSLADELGCVGVSILGVECNARLVQQIEERGLRVWVWTVNKEAEWERLTDGGVAGIATDTPLTLRHFLDDRRARARSH